jgi:hypothetical protein
MQRAHNEVLGHKAVDGVEVETWKTPLLYISYPLNNHQGANIRLGGADDGGMSSEMGGQKPQPAR